MDIAQNNVPLAYPKQKLQKAVCYMPYFVPFQSRQFLSLISDAGDEAAFLLRLFYSFYI
ncbi:MAG: hypothetical protein K2J00_02615 [Bacteroidaceae bacterium]|nr:hypothetical protein [Bacteroidaceae bacterium]